MKKTRSFFLLFSIVYCPAAIVSLAMVYFFGFSSFIPDILWGSGVSIVLIWTTIIATERMIDKSIPWFLGLVIGGFAFRFFIVIGAGIYVYLTTELHIISFFIGLLGSYFLLQILELIYLQKLFSKSDVSTHEDSG